MLTSGDNVGYFSGSTIPTTPIKVNHSQIYNLTHDLNDRSDTFINRSYLSFSFGGKNIEDFELIVTNQGMMQKSTMGTFKDLTSSYDVIDGQFYWGTHFVNNQINLTLSTDSMTQEHLDAFVDWFQPGEARELIMAEHPNRAIIARVMDVPIMNIVPFEEPLQITIHGEQYITSTTLYKGSITLNFIMDSPFWYAKSNLLAKINNEIITQWNDANNNTVTLPNRDMARIIFEDRIVPKESMGILKLFGDRFIYNSNDIKLVDGDILQIENNTNLEAIFNFNSELSIGPSENAYIFYGGTAPSKPIIQFTLPILYDNDDSPYRLVKLPFNSAIKSKGSVLFSSNAINISGKDTQLLEITAPNVYMSYNQAQWCIANASSYKNLRELLNDKVSHYHVKRWASRAIDYMEYYDIQWSDAINRLKVIMYYFIYDADGKNKYVIDSGTNHAYARLIYRKIIDWEEFPSGDNGWKTYGMVNSDIEDVSDIILSNYIELKERNHLNANGDVAAWDASDKTATHIFSHNFNVELTDVAVLFKNMYY